MEETPRILQVIALNYEISLSGTMVASSDTGNGTKWTLNPVFERAAPEIIERLSSGHPARDVYTGDATDFDNRSNRYTR